MVVIRLLCIILCPGLGIGYYHASTEASEPTIYSKMLTPSPLGEDRILILCSVSGSDSEKQNKFYESILWNEFIERDLTVIEVSKNTVSTVLLVKGANGDNSVSKARHHDYGNELRNKANCKNDFELILIGKDTGVKARWKTDFSQEDLFKRIDAMSMRRFEMQERNRIQ